MNIFLTGATGAVGSYHVPYLLRRGHQVTCLVRGSNPRARLLEVMKPEVVSKIDVVSGDITFTNAGISQEELVKLKSRFDMFIHHAGSVKFDDDLAAETFTANIGGTANMLSLAEKMEVPVFVYNSSTYATNGRSRNPYEASKATAERLVQKWSGEKFMILRPSIIVGDSVTGETNSYTGYYGWLAGFSYMKYQFKKLWDQSQASCQGFHFDGDRLIFKEPLWLDYSATSTLNLIPIDWLVVAMTDLIENGKLGYAYNLANPNPQKMQWMIENSFDILGIDGVKRRTGISQYPTSQILFETQQHMDSRLRIYYPYVTAEDEYGCEALNGEPPIVDRAFLKTMLHYALKTKFGHNKT